APTSTHTTTVELNLYTAVPGSVTLTDPADGEIDVSLVPTFMWTAATQGASYYLEVATDIAFSNVVYSATTNLTSHTMSTALSPLTTYYWHVRATNTCGTGSFSSTFDFITRDIPPILLVDDDDNAPDVRSYYTDTLDALGLFYDVWDTGNSDNEPTTTDLLPYKIVIWFTGVEFGGFAGPGSAGESALSSWLDSSGDNCYYISSQDYTYDRGLTPFMTDYLGVQSFGSDAGDYTSVTGAGSVFGGLGPYTLIYPFIDFSDRLTPDATAEVAFVGNNNNDAALDKIGPNGYRSTFWGFPFEAIPNLADRMVALNTWVNWCAAELGTLTGTVTDVDSSLGIEDATITADDGVQLRTTTTDPSGVYTISMPVGTYTVTASATNYVSQTVPGVVVTSTAPTVQDFALQGSSLLYTPPFIEESMNIGDVVTNTVTVTNTGPLTINYDVNIGSFGGPDLAAPASPVSIPASDGNFPRGATPASTAPAPATEVSGDGSSAGAGTELSDLLGAPAYGVEINFSTFQFELSSFDTDTPGTLNVIGTIGGDHFVGADFLNGDFSTLYVLDDDADQFVAIDTATAGVTVIGTSTAAGEDWTGMANDPTGGVLYASSSACSISSSLYTIDVATGAATLVGSIGSGTCIIGIAVDAAGQMYGVDLIADNLLSIDKATGTGTVIGSIGYDANFSQGMDFDEATGTLFLAAYNNSSGTAELRIADTATGNSTLVGPLGTPGTLEMTTMAVATGGVAGGWAYAVPDSGAIGPFSTSTFDVVFDASSLYQVGDYTAQLDFSGTFVNDPPVMPLTMHLSCPTCGFLTGNIYDDFTNDPLTADIHITGPSSFDVTLSGDSYSLAVQPGSYDFTVEANDYFSETATIVATQGVTTTTDFYLTPMVALLDYTPPAIEEFMEIGDVVTNTVTVTNSGTIPLNWQAEIGNYGWPGLLTVRQSSVTPLQAQPYQPPAAAAATATNLGQFAESDVHQVDRPIQPESPLQDVILDQQPNQSNGIFSDVSCDLCGGPQVLAENFSLSGSETIGQIVFWTGYFPGDVPIDPDTITVIFHEDTGGLPGPAVYTETDVSYERVQTGIILFGVHEWMHTLTLASPVTLGPGNFWVEIYNDTGFGTDDFFWEVGNADTVGNGLPGSAFAFAAPGSGWLFDSITDFAIQLITGSAGPEWAYAAPESGTIPAYSTSTFEVVFDASSLYQVGDYTAELSFSGDFDNVAPVMPLTMHLSCSTCGFLVGSITDAITNDPVGADIHVTGPSSFDVTVSGESYSLAVQPGSYDFTVSADGYISETATIVATQGVTTTTDFALTPIAAILEYAPNLIEVTVPLGGSAQETLVMTNTGSLLLTYDLADNAPWVNVLPNSGTIQPGQSVDIDVNFNSASITQPGTYTATLILSGNFVNPVGPATLVMHVVSTDVYLPFVIRGSTAVVPIQPEAATWPLGGLVLLPAAAGLGFLSYWRKRR
ncbi:MAG: carboxypeptidase regulatory-like domain-containing protein, partial [Chloroflexi bacterium]|nr:carboxypeptidase regulatory-like domain-containing protein [Chloroflexota bacterium]